MNERIEQLAEQAGIEFTYDPTEVPMRAFVEAWEEDLEKFAELIVKECMKLNHEHFSDEDPYSIDSLYRYHFGFQ
jgi:hypothetical protein